MIVEIGLYQREPERRRCDISIVSLMGRNPSAVGATSRFLELIAYRIFLPQSAQRRHGGHGGISVALVFFGF